MHRFEGIESALEKFLQTAEPGGVCGCACEAHERACQRLAHDVIEKRADFVEQRDLSLAVAAAARVPIGSAIGLLGDRAGGQRAYDVRVELLRQDLELDRVTQCVQRLGAAAAFP